MTQKKDLKRRVRERQVLTGESYVTALRHVRQAVLPPDLHTPISIPRLPEPRVPSAPSVSIIELIDLTEIAEVLGLRCRVAMYPDLLGQIEVGPTLARLRSALHQPQPQLEAMRAVVLRGEELRAQIDVKDVRAFARRIRQGRPGINGNGHLLALVVDGTRGPVLVVFMLWLPPAFVHTTAMRARLVLSSVASWGQPWAP